MSDAIFHLEGTLCAELAEVKWVLGQIDTRLGELVHLVKFPRETEAKELVEDGVKALATRNLDDAEACLRNAVEAKRTSFQAHMNLAFVFLHKDKADLAITHFKKAADYAPATDRDGAQILAIENLARAYFAARNFAAARSVMERAVDLRKRHNTPSLHSDYQYATYCAQTGDPSSAIQIVVRLCKVQPTYFATASTDADFASIRAELLPALDDLARGEHQKATELLETAQGELEKSLKAATDHESIAPEVDAVKAAFAASRKWLGARNYSDSVRVVSACSNVSSILGVLPALPKLRRTLSAALDDEKHAGDDYRRATDEWSSIMTGHHTRKFQCYKDRERLRKTMDRFWIPVWIAATVISGMYIGWLAIFVAI